MLISCSRPLFVILLIGLVGWACDDGTPKQTKDVLGVDTESPEVAALDTESPEVAALDTNSLPTDTQDVSSDTVEPPLTATETVITIDELATNVPGAANLIDFALADLDGDGYTDLIGLEAGGTVLLARFDSTAGAGFVAFEAEVRVTIDINATLITTGFFDGDPRRDLAVYDPVTGKVRLIGAPARAFDNPLSAFDNPLSAFDNPLSAFDNPLSAQPSSWAVADLDGNGLDDLAFSSPESRSRWVLSNSIWPRTRSM